MSANYNEWFDNFKKFIDDFGSDELYEGFRSMLSYSRSTIALNRKIMEKKKDLFILTTL